MDDRLNANENLIEHLARQTATPIELVKDLYEKEVKTLKADATVDRFVSVIAAKRVKRKLRGSRRLASRTRG
jgi:Protein of unknown function (DUF3562)